MAQSKATTHFDGLRRCLNFLSHERGAPQVKSFGEALREQSLMEEMPNGFTFDLKSGDITCTIDMRQSGFLDISVSPEHLPESRELFATLQRWAGPIRPPTWQRLW